MATMRAMVKQRLSIGLVLMTAMFAAANCDSGDTLVSVNVSYDSTAMDVQKAASSLEIVIKPKSGSGSPSMTSVTLMRDSTGAITTPSYTRITVNGWTGLVDVSVDARDGSGSSLLTATTTAELSEHGAVVANVKFTRTAPVTTDAGTDVPVTGGSGGMTGSGGADASGSGGA